jgi:hypothetical protein
LEEISDETIVFTSYCSENNPTSLRSDLIQEFGAARDQHGLAPSAANVGNDAADPIARAGYDSDIVLQLLIHCHLSAAMARRPGYRVRIAMSALRPFIPQFQKMLQGRENGPAAENSTSPLVPLCARRYLSSRGVPSGGITCATLSVIETAV